MEAREDVENLFRIDHLPLGAEPNYDDLIHGRIRAKEIVLAPPWNETSIVLDELRFEVVRAIIDMRTDEGALRHFTLLNALTALGYRDVVLEALLVNPECVPLLAKVAGPKWGGKLRLFQHMDVPVGEVYGLAGPDYVGVVSVRKGIPGVLLHNPHGIVWGHFPRRPGV